MRPQLFRQIIYVGASQTLRFGVQGLYFVLLTRALGPSDYGAFGIVVALVSAVTPFASLGAGNLMIRAVARDNTRSRAAWTYAFGVTLVSSVALTGIIAGAATLLDLQLPISSIVLIAIADLMASRFVDVVSQAYQAHGDLRVTALLPLSLNIARLAGLSYLLISRDGTTVEDWAFVYFAVSIAVALPAVVLASSRFGLTWRGLKASRQDLGQGSLFAISLSSQNIYNDLDKLILGQFAPASTAGIYIAAYRFVDLAFAPVRAVLVVVNRRLFQAGTSGVMGSWMLGRRLLLPAAIYSGTASLALIISSPLAPRVLGEEYGGVSEILPWLAPILLLRATYYIAADILTTGDKQGRRSLVQVGVALANVLITVPLVISHQALGAAVASLITDVLLVVLLWLTVLLTVKAARQPTTNVPHRRIHAGDVHNDQS